MDRPSTQVRPSRLADWWLPACTLTLIFASDYQLRNRPPEDALAASVDSTILIELGLYGLVAAYLVLVHGAPLRIRSVHPTVYFAGLLVGLMALSLSYTLYPQYAVVRVGQMVVLLSLTVLAASKATRADFHRLAHAFMVFIALSIAYGVAVPSVPINARQVGRFTWFAIHPTVSGILAGLATLIALTYVTGGRRPRPGPRWPPLAYLALLALNGAALLGAQTRGAIAGVVAGALVVLVASRREPRTKIEMVLATSVLSAGVALAASDRIMTYLTRGEDPEQLATLNSRTDLWGTALRAFTENPMFGYGVTSSRGLFYSETGLGGGHNAVVNILVELGAVGTLCWAVLVGLVVKGILGLRRDGVGEIHLDRALLLGSMAFLVVDGLFYEGIGSVTNVASTWFFMCLAWARVADRAGTRAAPEPLRHEAHAHPV